MSAPKEPARAVIKLEVELGADPIRGELRDAQGARSRFTGWLELVGALERITRPRRGRTKDFGRVHDAPPGSSGDDRGAG